MVYLDKKDYKFLKFEKSNTKNKKYDAVLQNKKTKREKRLPFGSAQYSQFYDKTGLNLYTHLDHNDQIRRRKYIQRHTNFVKDGYYSPGYFSLYYLW